MSNVPSTEPSDAALLRQVADGDRRALEQLYLRHAEDVTAADGAVWLVRSVVALGAVTVVFALDDPSIDMTRAPPAARGALMQVRFAVGGVALVASVVPVVLTSWAHLNARSTLVGVALEVCVLLALTLSAALVMQRQFGISEPAQFVVLVVLGLMMAAQLLGQRWPLLVPPGPEWAEAHGRWAGVLAAALLVMAWQLRDAAARPLRRSPAWQGGGSLAA